MKECGCQGSNRLDREVVKEEQRILQSSEDAKDPTLLAKRLRRQSHSQRKKRERKGPNRLKKQNEQQRKTTDMEMEGNITLET